MSLLFNRDGNSLFCSFSQNRSYYRATVSDSLSLLFKKERPLANRSCRSIQNSNCEQIALNFFKIRSGRSWQKSDRSNLLFFTSESLFRSEKTSDSLEKTMSKLQIPNPVIFKQINWKIIFFYFWLTFAVIKQNGNLLINPLDAGELFCLQILYNLDML